VRVRNGFVISCQYVLKKDLDELLPSERLVRGYWIVLTRDTLPKNFRELDGLLKATIEAQEGDTVELRKIESPHTVFVADEMEET